MSEWTDVDEPAIVVTVRWRKAPRPAAALHGEPNCDAVLAHDAVDRRIDPGDLASIHRGGNAAQAHCAFLLVATAWKRSSTARGLRRRVQRRGAARQPVDERVGQTRIANAAFLSI